MRKRAAGFCLLLLAVISLSHSARAQYQVRGVTLDKETKQPLPFVSIAVSNTTMGTASNENGEFTLNLPSLPHTLIFSEISHVKDTVRVTSADKPLQIALAPASVTLPEVKVGSYAFQLVDRAYGQMRKNYDQKFYSKAFYRQVTRINNEPTEIQEAVWNVKSNNSRIEGVSVAQGRYAAKQALMNFKNFSFYTKAYGLYDPLADSTTSLAVLSPNTVKNYYLEIVGVVERGEGGVAEIAFETRPEINYRAKGTIWVDVDTYKVERFKITTPNFTMQSNNPTLKFANKQLQVELVFLNTPAAASPLEYIKVNQSFDITQPIKGETKMNVSAFTYFYDTNETPPAGVTYAKVSREEKDLDTIKETKYDPEFWANNPVVKRTPVEDEVIQSFEQKGAFGTMLPPKATKPATRKLR